MANLTPSEEMSNRPYSCFVEFRVTDQDRFQALSRVFEVLRQEKQRRFESEQKEDDGEAENNKREEKLVDTLFDLFDEEALAHFWWPSPKDREEFKKRWETTPWHQRQADSSLKTSWVFESFIASFIDGEYELVSCSLWTPESGILEFFPFALPYGGTDCMKALIEAFGFQIIGEDDGSGYVSYL